MFDQQDVILETERFFLRRLVDADIANILEIFQDEDAMRYSPAETTQTEADARNFLNWNIKNYAECGYGAWAVINKTTGSFVGQAGIMPQTLPEIFYSILPRHWGKGYATEVANALVHYALTTLDLNQVISIIHPFNSRAIRVAQKAGLHDSGEIDYFGRNNRLFKLNSLEYSNEPIEQV